MSTFTITAGSTNPNVLFNGQPTGTVNGGYVTAACTSNNTGNSGGGWSTTPSKPFGDAPTDNTIPVHAVCSASYTSSNASYDHNNYIVILAGNFPQNFFTSITINGTITLLTSGVYSYSTTLIPGFTMWVWGLGLSPPFNFSPGGPGSVTPVQFNGLVVPTHTPGAGAQYQAPTDLFGAYDPLAAAVDLSWDAAVDGIVQIYTPGSYLYPVDLSAYYIDMIADGGGGGGGSGVSGPNFPNIYTVGQGAGGGGYAAARLFMGMFQQDTNIAVAVGAGGVGGVASPASNTGFTAAVYGTSGGSTSFGAYHKATGGFFGGGDWNYGNNGQIPNPPGGTGFTVSFTNVTLDTGGLGAFGWTPGNGVSNSRPGLPSAGGKAGGGGGAGESSGGNIGGQGETAVGNGGTGGSGGAVSGGNGASAAADFAGGGGGGGGGSIFLSTPGATFGGNGGNGGLYGGGGGGGGFGAAQGPPNFAKSGSGGNGGDGVLWTKTVWKHTHDPQYLVYRGATLIGTTAQGVTTFVDLSPQAGANVYTVIASYDGVNPQSPSSMPTTVTLSGGAGFASGKFSFANAFAPIMLINAKGIKPRFYPPVTNQNLRSRR